MVVQVVVVSFASTPDLFSILGLPERHSFRSLFECVHALRRVCVAG